MKKNITAKEQKALLEIAKRSDGIGGQPRRP